MKNILNWTFGSFFRTIGRIACYLIIGGIIAYFMSDRFSNGNFRLTDLFGIQKVSASTFQSRIVDNVSCKVDTTSWNCITDNFYSKILFQPQTKEIHRYTFDFSPQLVQSNSIVYVPIVLHRYSESTGRNDYEIEYSSTTNQYYYYYSDSTDYYKFLVNVFIIDNQNNFVPCILHQSSLPNLTYACPVGTATSFSGVSIETSILSENSYSENNQWYFGFYRQMQVELDSTQAITDSINSQTQVIQETNSTSEANDTYSFFSSYDNDTQNQLAQVVSAPLTLLNNLIVGTDTKLCFTLKGKQSCIPSGRIIWGKTSRTSFNVGSLTFHPIWFGSGDNITNGITSFVALFNLVVGGFLAYKMLLSLYRMVDDMLNPTNNRIEVLKL